MPHLSQKYLPYRAREIRIRKGSNAKMPRMFLTTRIHWGGGPSLSLKYFLPRSLSHLAYFLTIVYKNYQLGKHYIFCRNVLLRCLRKKSNVNIQICSVSNFSFMFMVYIFLKRNAQTSQFMLIWQICPYLSRTFQKS